jgi:hypothetical protein
MPPPFGLQSAYQLQVPTNFNQLTSDPVLAQALATVYVAMNRVDTWIAGLAQDHAPGASVGAIFKAIIENQFTRLRDGDRLFYRGNAAGLYTNGVLNPEIAAIVDLDALTLADIIRANTTITQLQQNVFFLPIAGDYNLDGVVDAGDYVVWRKAFGTSHVLADGDGNGTVGPEDFDIWRGAFGGGGQLGSGQTEISGSTVPEPYSIGLLASFVLVPFAVWRRDRYRRCERCC